MNKTSNKTTEDFSPKTKPREIGYKIFNSSRKSRLVIDFR